MFFVSGGTGFIGSHLCEKLNEMEVPYKLNGAKNEQISTKKHLFFHDLEGQFEQIQCVFHQAADNNTQINEKNRFFKANVEYTLELLKKSFKEGVKNFVIASSTAVYGDASSECTEESELNPLTYYAESKIKMEESLKSFSEENGVKVTCLRYCNVFGKNENHKRKRASMVYQCNEKIKNNEKIKLFEFGEQIRNWCFVKDIVNYNLNAYVRQITSSDNFEIFNAAGPKENEISFNNLIEIYSELYCKKIDVVYIKNPYKSTYQNNLSISIKKAEEKKLYSPFYDLKNGIKTLLR